MYHIPTALLTERENLVVLFEESSDVHGGPNFSNVAFVVLH